MRRHCSVFLLGLVAVLSGCYHATIETGAKPSTATVEKKWASGWVFGLVPPKTLETQAKCGTGVSKVETRLSFLNMLVSALTLNIYTPMDIRVTCAEGAAGSALVPASDSVPPASQSASALGAPARP